MLGSAAKKIAWMARTTTTVVGAGDHAGVGVRGGNDGAGRYGGRCPIRPGQDQHGERHDQAGRERRRSLVAQRQQLRGRQRDGPRPSGWSRARRR